MARPRNAGRRVPSGSTLELEVERLVHGPGAMARTPDGRVVLLDAGLPGERVRAQVVEERRDFVRARVVRALGGPAATRRSAPCPVVALCGGCPWQALDYGAQVAAKERVVLRELERAGRVAPATVHPPIIGDEWRTRHRVRLAVARHGDAPPTVGYRARASRTIVPIEDCLIARAELSQALPLARRLAVVERSLREVELSIDDRGALRLRGVCASARPRCAGSAWEELRSVAVERPETRPVGLVLEAAHRRTSWRREAGDVVQRLRIRPGMEIGVPLGVFTQVNGALNRALVADVVREAGVAAGPRIVDLFCGAGNFALALARDGADVLGIDSDARAIAAARASAAALGLGDRAHFRVGRADAPALDGWTQSPDVVILDPPRAGAAAILPGILALRPAKLIYVSCDVATFGRDARVILGAGWRLSSLRLVDLTPQTYRAEVLGVFELTWEGGDPYRDA